MTTLRSGLASCVLVTLLVSGCAAGGRGEPTRTRDEVGILVAPPPQVRDGEVTIACAAALIAWTSPPKVQIGGGAIDGGGVRWWACDGGVSPVGIQ